MTINRFKKKLHSIIIDRGGFGNNSIKIKKEERFSPGFMIK